jgi:hypothetical protein
MIVSVGVCELFLHRDVSRQGRAVWSRAECLYAVSNEASLPGVLAPEGVGEQLPVVDQGRRGLSGRAQLNVATGQFGAAPHYLTLCCPLQEREQRVRVREPGGRADEHLVADQSHQDHQQANITPSQRCAGSMAVEVLSASILQTILKGFRVTFSQLASRLHFKAPAPVAAGPAHPHRLAV